MNDLTDWLLVIVAVLSSIVTFVCWYLKHRKPKPDLKISCETNLKEHKHKDFIKLNLILEKGSSITLENFLYYDDTIGGIHRLTLLNNLLKGSETDLIRLKEDETKVFYIGKKRLRDSINKKPNKKFVKSWMKQAGTETKFPINKTEAQKIRDLFNI